MAAHHEPITVDVEMAKPSFPSIHGLPSTVFSPTSTTTEDFDTCCDERAEPFTNDDHLNVESFRQKVLPADCRVADFDPTPWDQRNPGDDDTTKVALFGVLVSRHILNRCEYAIRLAFAGLLPCALLAYHHSVSYNWVVRFMLLVPCIVAAQPRLGHTIAEAICIAKALVLNLILVEIVVSINPARHWAAWGVVWAVIILLVATFTHHLTTKMTLYFFCIHMVLHWKNALKVHGHVQEHMFPLHFMKPVALGIGFAIWVPLFPYPRFNRQVVEQQLSATFSSIAIIFHGVCNSFWCDSNTEREINLAKILAIRSNISQYLAEVRANIPMMDFEPNSAKVVAHAKSQMDLAERLLASLDGMISMVKDLCNHPEEFDSNDRAQEWGKHFKPALLCSCEIVDEFFNKLSHLEHHVLAQEQQKLLVIQELVNRAYVTARKRSLVDVTEWTKGNFPARFLGYQLFNYGNFFSILTAAHLHLEKYAVPPLWKRVLMMPVHEALHLFHSIRDLFALEHEMLLKLREALKLTFAMTTAVAFLLSQNAQDPAGGAVVIGFIKDANPAVNVIAGVEFILGTVLGSVMGFLVTSVSVTFSDFMIWTVTVSLVTGFMRTGNRFGHIGFLTQFFALDHMQPGVNASKEDLTNVIQQNVAAMFWLVATHLLLWPSWPSVLLRDMVTGLFCKIRRIVGQSARKVKGRNPEVGEEDELLCTVRSDLYAAFELVRFAAQEPSLKKLPFPDVETSNLLRAIQRTVGVLAPFIEAMHCGLKRDRRAFTESTQPAAIFLMNALEESLDSTLCCLERLLHEICTALKCPATDMTCQLFQHHRALAAAANKLAASHDEAYKKWWIEFSSNPNYLLSRPFQVPATQTLAHSITLIARSSHELVLRTVELNRKRSLRA